MNNLPGGLGGMVAGAAALLAGGAALGHASGSHHGPKIPGFGHSVPFMAPAAYGAHHGKPFKYGKHGKHGKHFKHYKHKHKHHVKAHEMT